MAIIQSSRQGTNQNNDCGDCEGSDTATQKSIHVLRKKYCDELYTSAGEVSKYETQYTGQLKVFENKKCLFVWTESNYRRYRNTEIGVATELLQSNELIGANIGTYISWSDELTSGLKNLVKSVKDVKTKLGDLRASARKLKDCKNDGCNCSQMTVLTGEVSQDCEGKTKPPQEKRPEECSDVKDVLDALICMPEALGFDADYLLKAASDVVGIQAFSNISTLDTLQKAFSDDAKAFGKFIQETTKKRESDVKKTQEDLVKSVQETTKSAAGLYNERSQFEGAMCTTKAICCPKCGCVVDATCEPRLGKCKEDICDICRQVKDTFCKEEKTSKAN